VPGEDPFEADADPGQRDAQGQSRAVNKARAAADRELKKEASVKNIWTNYLKQFKQLYALDPGQCATADSVLREFLERLATTLQNQAWRDRIYRARLWLGMAPVLRLGGPTQEMLNRRYQQSMNPINALGDEFRGPPGPDPHPRASALPPTPHARSADRSRIPGRHGLAGELKHAHDAERPSWSAPPACCLPRSPGGQEGANACWSSPRRPNPSAKEQPLKTPAAALGRGDGPTAARAVA